MSYSHPSIVFSKSVVRRLSSQNLSTRPNCPRCNQGSLTGQLCPDYGMTGFDTVCSNPECQADVHINEKWQVTGYSWKGCHYILSDATQKVIGFIKK